MCARGVRGRSPCPGNTLQSCGDSACSSRGQRPPPLPLPRAEGTEPEPPAPRSTASPHQQPPAPCSTASPHQQPPALPETPEQRVQQGTPADPHAPHTPPLSLQAFSGQLLPTVRGADTILQGRKGDREPSRPINHPVREDNPPVLPSSFQSHSPHCAWAPRLPRVGQGSARTLQLPTAPPQTSPPLLQLPTTRARGFGTTPLNAVSVTFSPLRIIPGVLSAPLSGTEALCT